MILVVGMARSGVAAARLLKSRGKDVLVTDSGKPQGAEALLAAGIGVETGGHTADLFLAAEEIVVSPGVPPDIPPIQAARVKGVPIVSELEVASRYLRGSVIAITGSNGKTTTTTLVGEILKAGGLTVQVGGNIGTAMCGLVETSTPATINVIEVSSFQLDGIRSFRPNTAAVLNVTPDHLDRYAGFAEYRMSKFRIFENQRQTDVAVLNRDDSQVVPPPVPVRSTIRYFSRKEPVQVGASRIGQSLCLNGEPVLPVSDLKLRGEHNIENVLAAMAIVDGYGVTSASLARAVREFRGVEHRLEFVRSVAGVEYFNDSKATNVDSSIKAVNSFDRNVIIILGGRDKGAPYDPLVSAMKGRVRHVLLLGEAAERIAAAVGGVVPSRRVTSLETAVQEAAKLAASGDVVLLSPACASYDMFDNYEHRGRVFKQAVLELPA